MREGAIQVAPFCGLRPRSWSRSRRRGRVPDAISRFFWLILAKCQRFGALVSSANIPAPDGEFDLISVLFMSFCADGFGANVFAKQRCLAACMHALVLGYAFRKSEWFGLRRSVDVGARGFGTPCLQSLWVSRVFSPVPLCINVRQIYGSWILRLPCADGQTT